MAHSTNEIKKPQKNISERISLEIKLKYFASLSNSEFFCCLMEANNNVTIEELAEYSNVSDSLIRKLRYNNDYKISREKLQQISYYGLRLTLSEAEILFNRYGFTINLSNQQRDIQFKNKLKAREGYPHLNISHLSKKYRLEYITRFLEIDKSVTQNFLAKELGVSPRTISRYFKELSINNSDSRKRPNWILKN